MKSGFTKKEKEFIGSQNFSDLLEGKLKWFDKQEYINKFIDLINSICKGRNLTPSYKLNVRDITNVKLNESTLAFDLLTYVNFTVENQKQGYEKLKSMGVIYENEDGLAVLKIDLNKSHFYNFTLNNWYFHVLCQILDSIVGNFAEFACCGFFTPDQTTLRYFAKNYDGVKVSTNRFDTWDREIFVGDILLGELASGAGCSAKRKFKECLFEVKLGIGKGWDGFDSFYLNSISNIRGDYRGLPGSYVGMKKVEGKELEEVKARIAKVNRLEQD